MNSTAHVFLTYHTARLSPSYLIFGKPGKHLLETWILLNSMGLLAFDLGLVQGQGIDPGASSQEISWCPHSSESWVLLDWNTMMVRAFTVILFLYSTDCVVRKMGSFLDLSFTLTTVLLNQIFLILLLHVTLATALHFFATMPIQATIFYLLNLA